MKIKLIDVHYKDKYHPGDVLHVGKDIPKTEASYFIMSKNAEVLEEIVKEKESPKTTGGK